MTYRAECAEIWQIVAEQRAAKVDWPGMLTALNNRQILLGVQQIPNVARFPGWSWSAN